MWKRGLIVIGVMSAVGLGGYAVAQSPLGIDVGAITDRAEADAADQEAFVRDVMKRGDAVREDASGIVSEAQAAAAARVKGYRLGSDGLIDFDAILDDAADLQNEDVGRAPRLIVFASLSMPEPALKALIKDTAKAGGAVVFRGFPGNSMKAFQTGIAKVVEDQGDYGNIGIDPRLFRAFNVDAVPTFVVVSSDFDPCDGFDCTTDVPPFDRMSGNVTLEHVLTTFSEGGGPGASVAGVAHDRLTSKVGES